MPRDRLPQAMEAIAAGDMVVISEGNAMICQFREMKLSHPVAAPDLRINIAEASSDNAVNIMSSDSQLSSLTDDRPSGGIILTPHCLNCGCCTI